jgi:hypothetical protein
MGFRDRISKAFSHGWNAFVGVEREDYSNPIGGYGGAYTSRPDRTRLNISNERSIISSIYTRIAIDVASTPIQHIRKDKNGRFVEQILSGLNNCLNVEANIDQAASAFRLDMVLSMFDTGSVAIVPTDVSTNPLETGGYDIEKLRVGQIVAWYPKHVRVLVYNENTGRKEELFLPKTLVAIVENPFYTVMNEPNSTLQRLIRKLNLLDAVDEASSSGKLDLIIQLPYVVKSEARREQAEARAEAIETQLKGSKYGIAWTDGTEKITQLNRPAENNMLGQIEFLTELLYSQLSVSKSVIDGTADAKTMLNYNNRTVEPILRAFVEAFVRTFLTKTARTQGQSLQFLSDPFKLVPIEQLAEIGDKMIRNAILTANEFRGIIGFRPLDQPGADKLVNPNMPDSAQPSAIESPKSPSPKAVAMEARVQELLAIRDTPARELKQLEAARTK